MGNGKMIFKKMHSVVARWLVMAVATMFVSISHAQTTAQDPIEVGAAALARGHSATAYRAWIDLARAGNAQAQNNIGYLYEHGLGLSQSYQSAMEWRLHRWQYTITNLRRRLYWRYQSR